MQKESTVGVEGQERSVPPSNNHGNATAGRASDSRHLDVVYYSVNDTGLQPTAFRLSIAHGYETAIQSLPPSIETKFVLFTDYGPHSPFSNISSSYPFMFAKHCFTMSGSLALFPTIKGKMQDLIDHRL